MTRIPSWIDFTGLEQVLPQEFVDLEHPDALITFHPQQVTVVRDDRFGTRVDGAFDDTIVVWIAGHYIKSDLRHDPHSAFADVFLLPRKALR